MASPCAISCPVTAALMWASESGECQHSQSSAVPEKRLGITLASTTVGGSTKPTPRISRPGDWGAGTSLGTTLQVETGHGTHNCRSVYVCVLFFNSCAYVSIYVSGRQNYLFGPVVFLDQDVPYRSPHFLLHYVSLGQLDFSFSGSTTLVLVPPSPAAGWIFIPW